MYKKNKILWGLVSLAIVALLVAIAFRATQPAEMTNQATISFTGLVNDSLNFSLDDIMSMPNVTVTAELICVSGQSYGTHDWTGVRLSYLLNLTGIREGVVKVAFYAADGYITDLKIEDAIRSDVIVAYQKDGTLLSERTRLVVPGMWGYKWVFDIETIRLVDYNFMGDWEGRGYPDNATIPD